MDEKHNSSAATAHVILDFVVDRIIRRESSARVMGNELCTVVRGLDGNSLWCGEIDLGTSSFTGWVLLDGATPSAPTLTS